MRKQLPAVVMRCRVLSGRDTGSIRLAALAIKLLLFCHSGLVSVMRIVPRIFSTLAVCILLLQNSSFADNKESKPLVEDEDQALILNLAENWKLANKRSSGNEYVLQYLPQGADLRKPNEMITVTTVMDSSRNAKTYILQVRDAMASVKGAGSFNWHMVKDSENDSSCEYSLSGNSKVPDQHEIMRVIRGAGELHAVIYHFGKRIISDVEKARAWSVVDGVKLAPVTEH